MTLLSSLRAAATHTLPFTLTAAGCFLSVSMVCRSAHGQAVTGPTNSVRVPLTDAAFLPVTSEGNLQTSIATALDGQAGPWTVALTFSQPAATDGTVGYALQVTNATDQPLSLPVDADGTAIWNACQGSLISEVDIDLRVPGQIAPLVSLPAAHSCDGVDASSASVLPGQSVIFTGSLPGSSVPSDQTTVSAVMSVCSASYSLDGDNPQTTRSCQAPISSAPPVSSTATVSGAQ